MGELDMAMVYGHTGVQNPLEQHLERVVNVTWNFAGRCETWQDHVTNAVLGLAGEAGEVADIHKKIFFHTEKDYRHELISELGDVCFYLAKVLELHGISLEECLENNRAKLASRHPELGQVTERFGKDYIR